MDPAIAQNESAKTLGLILSSQKLPNRFRKNLTMHNFVRVALSFRKLKSNRLNRFCCVVSTSFVRIHLYRCIYKLFDEGVVSRSGGRDRRKTKIYFQKVPMTLTRAQQFDFFFRPTPPKTSS